MAGHITKPVGLSPKQDKLADECMAQHDKYKKTGEEQAKMGSDPTYQDLKNKVTRNPPTATASEGVAFAELAMKRNEVIGREAKERQEYIDMGCDKFKWVKDGTPSSETWGQRKARHQGMVDQLKSQLKNLEEAFMKALL